ncbi:PRTRC system protein A [Cupriavidus sp. AU9028]|uniref:PRTRC system protein A n=1 Tax=Cupriavidus sp. AU9028 TaxID=2871157 RepID=UPI001C98BCC9|nr:PRTRC system protein A [Cupriavidus sp. AU9028]MBY4898685.1 PRTRC system protein A [Cupriavidus sp. AU9028]
MSPSDITLQQSFPAVMVPRSSEVAPMERQGERLLVAQNGVYLEIVRPWVRLVRKLGGYDHKTSIPYGDMAEETALHCGRLPVELIRQFADMAMAAYPKETGAWIVWNAATHLFRLVPVTIREHSESHLRYDRPCLSTDDVLLVDCHSHGPSPAYFSPTDDEDDRYDVKFAFVLGNCVSPVPSMALRLCAKGIFEPVEPVPSDWYRAVRRKELS